METTKIVREEGRVTSSLYFVPYFLDKVLLGIWRNGATSILHRFKHWYKNN